jgi:hypothetical protein
MFLANILPSPFSLKWHLQLLTRRVLVFPGFSHAVPLIPLVDQEASEAVSVNLASILCI